jgi:hypothetical protein
LKLHNSFVYTTYIIIFIIIIIIIINQWRIFTITVRIYMECGFLY